MFGDLLVWPTRRRLIAGGVAVVAFAALLLASGVVGVVGGAITVLGAWWSIPAVAVGSLLIGLVVASYFGTRIGADATLCDTRWPAFGFIAMLLATDARSAVPLLVGITAPVVAVAAIVLLVWALHARLSSERRASADEGETCVTCRPLFPRGVERVDGSR